MPYIRGISRERLVAPVKVVVESPPEPSPEPEPEPPAPEPEVSYRDLQAQAKELGISAKQTKEELKAAIEEAEGG